MKKITGKNYLLIVLFALVVVGVIYLSIQSGSVKYFGIFILTLAILLVILSFSQRTRHTNTRHFRSKSRDELLRQELRK